MQLYPAGSAAAQHPLLFHTFPPLIALISIRRGEGSIYKLAAVKH